MKPYLFLTIGTIWLMFAILIHTRGFGIYFPRGTNIALMSWMFVHLLIPGIFFGWIAPVAFALWLLWRK
jgi:hypothetical protein